MITREMIKAISPRGKEGVINPLVGYLNQYMPKYGVNNYQRITHFLAQAAEESAGFRTLEEYADGSLYEGRKDLGNTQKGDGPRYKGRGIFQLTGRANYRAIGQKLNLDLEGNPVLAATPEVSVLIALEYWKSRNINPLADADDLVGVTKKINGGVNGLDMRKRYLAIAKTAIPHNINLGPDPTPAPVVVPPKPTPVNVVVAKRGDDSPYVADLQNMLNKKGATLVADGKYGPMTEQAVKDFQTKNKLKVTGSIDTDTLNKLMV